MRMPTRALENGKNAGVKLHAVGDNAKFVFLEICGAVIYLDVASRAAKKVRCTHWCPVTETFIRSILL